MSIKLINRNTDYAVQALCYMARREHKHKPHVTSVSELVEELKVPRAFIRKIMQILNNESVLLSKRGWGGGFRLAREPKKISLLEVVKVFQGPIKLSECVLQKEACPNKNNCFLRRRLGTIEQFINIQLKPITIEGMINGNSNVL